jgi:hypothetical protein
MFHAVSKIVLLTIATLAIALMQCGINPFGSSESGLKSFAYLGKAMSKPIFIHDSLTSKGGSKSTIADAQATAKRLAKGAVEADITALRSWLVDNGIESVGNDTFVYYEVVSGKPSDEDVDKLQTGRAEVKFTYASGYTPAIGALDPAKITGISTFEMIGHEQKRWNNNIDSIHLKIAFADPNALDLKPGKLWAWAKNISALQTQGAGDTAAFELDSLDDATHTQYGEGHFYDAHTGLLHKGDPWHFDFTMELIHKNTLDPSKPYLRFQDNEGIIYFYWERAAANPLYFTIHFYPKYERSGTIRDGGPTGQLLVEFNYNEKFAVGNAVYYNSKGEEVERENW